MPSTSAVPDPPELPVTGDFVIKTKGNNENYVFIGEVVDILDGLEEQDQSPKCTVEFFQTHLFWLSPMLSI